jgi:hypothetical protein
MGSIYFQCMSDFNPLQCPQHFVGSSSQSLAAHPETILLARSRKTSSDNFRVFRLAAIVGQHSPQGLSPHNAVYVLDLFVFLSFILFDCILI